MSAFGMHANQIEAANRAMTCYDGFHCLTVDSFNSVIVFILAVVVLVWFCVITIGCFADLQEKREDLGLTLAKFSMVIFVVIIAALFTQTI